METAQVNAAGVPLFLPAIVPATGGAVVIDWSGVPAGINGKEYASVDVAAMDTTARQALLDQLSAKYDGVMVDEGAGVDVGSLEMKLAPPDLALYQQLIQLGAVIPQAATAATPAAAGEPIDVDDIDAGAASEPRTLVLEEGDESPIGKTGIVQHPDGTTTALIVAPHGPIARLLELGDEIKHEATVTAHRVLVEIDQLVDALKKHL